MANCYLASHAFAGTTPSPNVHLCYKAASYVTHFKSAEFWRGAPLILVIRHQHLRTCPTRPTHSRFWPRRRASLSRHRPWRLQASVVTQNRPMRVTSKPANEKARDIDSDGSP